MDALRIAGLGAVGSFGAGRAALGSALAAPPQAPGMLRIRHGETHLELPARRADTAPLDAFIPRSAIRRADAFSRLALLGACLALEDAGQPRQHLGPETALVLASAHGATGSTAALLDSMIADGDAFSSPTHFAHSLHNSAAAHLSILLGIQGPNLTVSQGWASVPSALLSARTLLRRGRARRVLFGAVEELSEVTALHWNQVAPGRAAGEGAVFFLLEPGEGPGPRIEALHVAEPAEAPGPERIGSGDGPFDWDLADRFGLSHALPAFHLAAACLRVSGAPWPLHAGPAPAAVDCQWRPAFPDRASCRIVAGA